MYTFFEFVYQRRSDIFLQTFQHLYLTLIAVLLAIIVGLAIGILLTRYRKTATGVLGLLGVIQTIPSLALLGFMLPLLGIGPIPAIFALFLYALLPIVRNTYTGIDEVDNSIIEAARGMGMSSTQILSKVELPLAIPVIFSGIRTATVINVGIATLCSLIGAGGLGEFIFSGIALVNPYMTLAGAIPAALLALLLDGILGVLQKYIAQIIRPVLWITAILAVGALLYTGISLSQSRENFIAGFDPEFSSREDGYPALQVAYNLKLDDVTEVDAGIMYEALKEEKVDVISGYSTEGKIKAYNFQVLKDNKGVFPPYFVAPVLNGSTLRQYPILKTIFDRITGKIPDSTMQRLNFEVDKRRESPREVAKRFLESINLATDAERAGRRGGTITIGGKRFTEQYILLEMFKILIEAYSDLEVDLKKGMGGTQVLSDAVRLGEIDIYPEYTGTAYLVILKADASTQIRLGNDPNKVYKYVRQESQKRFQTVWLAPLGFNNSYALMMRGEQAKTLGIESIGDLQEYLQNRGR